MKSNDNTKRLATLAINRVTQSLEKTYQDQEMPPKVRQAYEHAANTSLHLELELDKKGNTHGTS
tara:strand:- start:618 stop:809 length:192 start_codon:yes stop_codon:yes gene_type:complete